METIVQYSEADDAWIVAWRSSYGRPLALRDETGRVDRIVTRFDYDRPASQRFSPEHVVARFAHIDDVFRSLE